MTPQLLRSATTVVPDHAPPLQLLLRLCGFETPKDLGYTIYYVRVSIESELPPENTPSASASERTWHVRKRYRQFLELQKQIISACGYAPPLPAKRVFGNLGTEFIKKRAQGLSIFLWSIASNPLFSNEQCVQRFLWSDVSAPKTRVLMSLTPMIRTMAGSASSITSPESHSSGSRSWDIDDSFDLDDAPQQRPQRRRQEPRQRGHSVAAGRPRQVPANGRLMLTSYEDLRQSFEAEGIPFEDVDDCEHEEEEVGVVGSSAARAVNQLCNFSAFSKLCGNLERPAGARAVAEGGSAWHRAPKVMPEKAEAVNAKVGGVYAQRVVVPRLRFVFLLVGSRGDVQPYVALGVRLKEAGHYVRVAAHECFREFVEGQGLGFAHLAGDPKELMRVSLEYFLD